MHSLVWTVQLPTCAMARAGDCVRGQVSMRIQQLDVNCETKTKDNVFVHVVVSVQYQVPVYTLAAPAPVLMHMPPTKRRLGCPARL